MTRFDCSLSLSRCVIVAKLDSQQHAGASASARGRGSLSLCTPLRYRRFQEGCSACPQVFAERVNPRGSGEATEGGAEDGTKMEKTLHGPSYHTPSRTRQRKIKAWNSAVRFAVLFQSRPEIVLPAGRERGSAFHAKGTFFYRRMGF